MRVFSAHDVLRFAIRIEENGEVFYREAARVVSDQGVKEFFGRLATEELGHKRTFEAILASLGDYQPSETYEGEYLAYLQEYIDGKAIFKEHDAERGGRERTTPHEEFRGPELTPVSDTRSAFDFAIQREMDSIVYYQELRAFVPEKHHPTVDRVVDEERRHFSLLSEMKKTYR